MKLINLALFAIGLLGYGIDSNRIRFFFRFIVQSSSHATFADYNVKRDVVLLDNNIQSNSELARFVSERRVIPALLLSFLASF